MPLLELKFPKGILAFSGLICFRVISGKLSSALKDCELATTCYVARHPFTFLTRAAILEKLGRRDEAENEFFQAISVPLTLGGSLDERFQFRRLLLLLNSHLLETSQLLKVSSSLSNSQLNAAAAGCLDKGLSLALFDAGLSFPCSSCYVSLFLYLCIFISGLCVCMIESPRFKPSVWSCQTCGLTGEHVR